MLQLPQLLVVLLQVERTGRLLLDIAEDVAAGSLLQQGRVVAHVQLLAGLHLDAAGDEGMAAMVAVAVALALRRLLFAGQDHEALALQLGHVGDLLVQPHGGGIEGGRCGGSMAGATRGSAARRRSARMLLVLLLLRWRRLPGSGGARRGPNRLAGRRLEALQDGGLGLAQGLVAAVAVAIAAAQVEGVEAALDEQDAEERLGQRAEHPAFVGLAQLLD